MKIFFALMLAGLIVGCGQTVKRPGEKYDYDKVVIEYVTGEVDTLDIRDKRVDTDIIAVGFVSADASVKQLIPWSAIKTLTYINTGGQQ